MSGIWQPTGADPTRIPITLDPRAMRMEGTAVHGNTPFSVSYVTEILDDLWTGGCTNGLQLPQEIVHVVSLYPWETYVLHADVRSVLSVFMYDADTPPAETIDRVARWVNECRRDGPTLVHCQAGLNRSALIAARALVLDGSDAAAAIKLLREKRSPAVLCNRAFEHWLLEEAA